MNIENTIDQRKNSKKELILDINKLAKNKKFYQVSGVSPSKDNQMLAYAEDINGRREYTIKVKHIKTAKPFQIKFLERTGNLYGLKTQRILFTLKEMKRH